MNSGTGKKGRILYAEDNLVTSAGYIRIMKSAGYEVDHCVDGAVVLQKLTSGRYVLLVLDLMMPFLNGMDLLKHGSTALGKARVPIIVLSAISEEKVRQEVLDQRVYYYLDKANTSSQTLIDAINTVVGGVAGTTDAPAG